MLFLHHSIILILCMYVPVQSHYAFVALLFTLNWTSTESCLHAYACFSFCNVTSLVMLPYSYYVVIDHCFHHLYLVWLVMKYVVSFTSILFFLSLLFSLILISSYITSSHINGYPLHWYKIIKLCWNMQLHRHMFHQYHLLKSQYPLPDYTLPYHLAYCRYKYGLISGF